MSTVELPYASRTKSVPLQRASPRWGVVAVVLAWSVIILFLATYHLDSYPTTWFDEGSHLHVPKTLVEYGVYADISSEGFRFFGPTIGIGPTVMLPIALVFKIAGVGLIQARLVMVAYLIVSLILFAFVTRRLYGTGVALIASLLLASTPSVNLIENGRQVLGEVPAFAFLLLGILLWWRSTSPNASVLASVLAGLAFGLMALTKNQFALVLLPTFAVLFVADRWYYRQLRLSHFLVPCTVVVLAIVAGYVVLLLEVARGQDLPEVIALWRNASAGSILVLSPARFASSLKFLLGPDLLAFWALPSLLYGVVLARERSRSGLRQAFLVGLVVVCLSWFSVGSIGWARYAFPALAILPIFTAKLFYDLLRILMAGTTGLPDLIWRGRRIGVAALVFTFMGGLVVASPLANLSVNVLTPHTGGPQQMAAYVDSNIPPTAIVETWEPELGFLGDHSYHYPPPTWLDRAVRAKWLQSNSRLENYDPNQEAHPRYLINGPFSKYTGIYAQVVERLHTPPIASFGDYDLYALT